MKFLKKYIYIILWLVVAIPLIVLCYKISEDTEKITFEIHLAGNNSYFLDSYKNRKQLYMFIPGNIKMDSVDLATDEVTIDGKLYIAGDCMDVISLDDKHELIYKNKKYELSIFQGSEIPSLFLSTSTGSMNEVYSDKNHKEPISVMAYDKNGKLDLLDKTAYIKGRGNTTWAWGGKRPFNLIFDEEVSLLGLSKEKKVALLANAADYSNTKNKSAFMFSERLGLEWTPSSEYADLYIDGEYMGIYLACDKVECADNKIDLDDSKDYLLQSTTRIKNGDFMIYLASGQYFKVDYGDTQTSSLDGLISTLEVIDDDIVSGKIPDGLDMETFTKKYFLEQIVCNTDIHSWYFYLKNGQLFSGPAWDYDLAARYIQCYETVYAHKRSGWYDIVLNNDQMKNYMIALYDSEIKDKALDFIDDVADLEMLVQKSNQMNLIRWKKNYVKLDELYQEINDNYLRHLNYLNTAYLQNSDGYVLRVVKDGDIDFLYFADKDGNLSLPEECPLLNGVDGIRVDDGSKFDYNKPLTENISIYFDE